MSGGEEGPIMVPNPYKDALESARGRALGPAGEISRALDSAHRALSGGCWQSTTATGFGADLSGHRTTLGTVRDNAIGEFDDAIAGQPEQVESDAWQVRWRNLSVM